MPDWIESNDPTLKEETHTQYLELFAFYVAFGVLLTIAAIAALASHWGLL